MNKTLRTILLAAGIAYVALAMFIAWQLYSGLSAAERATVNKLSGLWQALTAPGKWLQQWFQSFTQGTPAPPATLAGLLANVTLTNNAAAAGVGIPAATAPAITANLQGPFTNPGDPTQAGALAAVNTVGASLLNQMITQAGGTP